MRKLWIVVLSLVALLLGAAGSVLWILPGQVLPTLGFSCRVLDEGQHLGLWSGEQRAAFVDQFNKIRHHGKPGAVPSDRALDRIVKGLEGNCDAIASRR